MSSDITMRLDAWRGGDAAALEPVMPELYATLRRMARQRLRRESDTLTLNATELVHEAMARLFGAGKEIANRAHFLSLSALYMRSILVERAREVIAGRRPGADVVVTLSHAGDLSDDSGAMNVVMLDDALRKLEELEPRAARAMELATFAGMQREEIAEVLHASIPTIDRYLRFARAYVNRAMD
jgi:RNA polymerase sigma factor (TIGR02999 family)